MESTLTIIPPRREESQYFTTLMTENSVNEDIKRPQKQMLCVSAEESTSRQQEEITGSSVLAEETGCVSCELHANKCFDCGRNLLREERSDKQKEM
jgi:hypothetical protein